MKKALITGVTGQDGSYLAEFLLSKNYEVHGIKRRSSSFNTQRIDHIYIDPHKRDARFFLHYGDLSDPGVLTEIIWNIKPDEIYHLGAQSHVKVSFDMPEYTSNITAVGTTRILEAIRRSKIETKFYQASSSEMFGKAKAPQNEQTPLYPRSPYAVSKVYAYWMTVNYREAYNLFACNGMLFNHESPRRGETFVTRKITRALANMLAGRQKRLYLGNLEAKRDWGFAPEYTEMMWLMLQQDSPDDFVIGTGKSHTVREFTESAFRYAGIDITWQGKDKGEKGVIKNIDKNKINRDVSIKEGDTVIEIDPSYFRPTEADSLQADISKAKQKLNWQPRTSFEELVKIMVDYDMKFIGLKPAGEGIRICNSKKFCYTKHDFSFYESIKERE